jgi:predicted dithiol-disulfide oxidoreductase (DUF899 family)
MDPTRLNESAEYAAHREKLRLAEVDLMRQGEAVASLRRQLPPGAAVDDYVFEEGPAHLADGDEPVRPIRLSELFSAPDRPLVIYHLMYGKEQSSPCPMCTMWVDGYNGVGRHLGQNMDFAIVAAAGTAALRAYGRERGWNNLRLLSSTGNSYKYDLGSEDEAGHQGPVISVFTLDAGGGPRHFYSGQPTLSEEINERGIDLLSPVWNLLDLTPQGRGEWYAGLDY